LQDQAKEDIKNNMSFQHTVPKDDDFSRLLDKSLAWGACKSALVPASKIMTRQDLADLCDTCPNQGLAPSCPPQVGGPVQFRQWQSTCHHALFLSMEVETAMLLSASRSDVFQMLHDLCAGLEAEAKTLGFSKAMAFAGGSCKAVFCSDQPNCMALKHTGDCPFPDRARPSMSGFGVDVAALIKTAGWENESFLEQKGISKTQHSGLYGLILLG
jgi:predicted metal-binding protein